MSLFSNSFSVNFNEEYIVISITEGLKNERVIFVQVKSEKYVMQVMSWARILDGI